MQARNKLRNRRNHGRLRPLTDEQRARKAEHNARTGRDKRLEQKAQRQKPPQKKRGRGVRS